MDGSVPAAKAKTNFGALLEKIHRAPITISKKGRPVAVLMSMEDFEAHQKLKLEHLRLEVQRGLDDLAGGSVVSGEDAFAALGKEIGD